MALTDIEIDGHLYQECDEFTMKVGKTYLVHSDATGYFLGTYAYASRCMGGFLFRYCQFYKYDYYGSLVPSGLPNKAEMMVSMVGILTRA